MAESRVPNVRNRSIPQDFEEILEYLGGFGKCQALVTVLLLCIEIPLAFISIIPVFVGLTPDPSMWICEGETLDTTSKLCSCNGTLEPIADAISISFVAEWSLVCDSAWVSDFITSIQLLGIMFGNLISSFLSDWYGRRRTFLGVNLLCAGGTLLSAVSPNPYLYGFARFLCGAGWSGSLALSAVYVIEFLPAKWRPLTGSLGPFGEGVMIFALIAYYVRPWRTLFWISLTPFALVFMIFWIVPESPRWLLRNQQLDETHKVLNFMARLNGTEPIELSVLENVAKKESPGRQNGGKEDATTTKVKRFSFFDFFRYKDLRLSTFCLLVIWSSWSLSYFGIMYNMKNQPGNLYLNVVYIGLADALGFPSFLLTANCLGRRRSVFIFTTICSIFLVVIAVMFLTVDVEAYQWIILLFSIIAKYGLAGERSAARCLTGETFPTSIRTMGVGLTACSAGITGFLAPQLVYLGTEIPSVPFFAFAFVSLCGSLCAFLMNETTGVPLTSEIRQNSEESEIDR